MKTIILTDAEYAHVRDAVAAYNDMSVDMLTDDIEAVNLFPQTTDDPQVLTFDKATQLRKEIDKMMTKAIILRALMSKFGWLVNEDGYTA